MTFCSFRYGDLEKSVQEATTSADATRGCKRAKPACRSAATTLPIEEIQQEHTLHTSTVDMMSFWGSVLSVCGQQDVHQGLCSHDADEEKKPKKDMACTPALSSKCGSGS